MAEHRERLLSSRKCRRKLHPPGELQPLGLWRIREDHRWIPDWIIRERRRGARLGSRLNPPIPGRRGGGQCRERRREGTVTVSTVILNLRGLWPHFTAMRSEQIPQRRTSRILRVCSPRKFPDPAPVLTTV